MSEDDNQLVINSRLRIPYLEFEFTYARSSGAGGQNVNKVNSKAILHWHVRSSPSLPFEVKERFLKLYGGKLNSEGQIVLSSDSYRDQPRNVADVLEKLKEMILRVAERPKLRKKTKPTFASKRRRLNEKKLNSEKKSARKWKRDID